MDEYVPMYNVLYENTLFQCNSKTVSRWKRLKFLIALGDFLYKYEIFFPYGFSKFVSTDN